MTAAIQWTEEMDQAIKLNEITFLGLAQKWGVPRSSVSRRAKVLGVSNPDWTAEEIEILKREWEKGTTTSRIGPMINKTKNAVIGKAHRIGLASRRPNLPPRRAEQSIKAKVKKFVEARQKAAKKLEAAVKKADRKAPVFYPAAQPLTDRAPISIMELNVDTCRAPVGRAPNGLVTYCGDNVFPGKVYCPGHCVLYYRPEHKRRA